jgi:nudix-type nucleoside diphosphatase (YffH/AdpP family)
LSAQIEVSFVKRLPDCKGVWEDIGVQHILRATAMTDFPDAFVFEAVKERYSEPEWRYIQTVLSPISGQATLPLTPELIEAAAFEILTYMRFEPAQEVALRQNVILVRAATKVQAQTPRNLGTRGVTRRGQKADSIDLLQHETPYSYFFAATDITVTHPRFDGSRSTPVQRVVFAMADAVTVLPYDPVRKRVLLIEQFRPGPYMRGDQDPWMLEPIAGRIDVGETAQTAARREASEEAKLSLTDLHVIAQYYPSPGGITEFLTSYVGIADLPDDIVGVAGLDSEQEDIASTLVSLDDFLALADEGALDTGPLLVSALWLARHHKRLDAGAPPSA